MFVNHSEYTSLWLKVHVCSAMKNEKLRVHPWLVVNVRVRDSVNLWVRGSKQRGLSRLCSVMRDDEVSDNLQIWWVSVHLSIAPCLLFWSICGVRATVTLLLCQCHCSRRHEKTRRHALHSQSCLLVAQVKFRTRNYGKLCLWSQFPSVITDDLSFPHW